jgi:hypothetical protein
MERRRKYELPKDKCGLPISECKFAKYDPDYRGMVCEIIEDDINQITKHKDTPKDCLIKGERWKNRWLHMK